MNAIAKHLDENRRANVIVRVGNVKANSAVYISSAHFNYGNDTYSKCSIFLKLKCHFKLLFQRFCADYLFDIHNKISAYLQKNNNLFTTVNFAQYSDNKVDANITIKVIQHLTANGRLPTTSGDFDAYYRLD